MTIMTQPKQIVNNENILISIINYLKSVVSFETPSVWCCVQQNRRIDIYIVSV